MGFEYKYLGVIIYKNLNFLNYIKDITKKIETLSPFGGGSVMVGGIKIVVTGGNIFGYEAIPLALSMQSWPKMPYFKMMMSVHITQGSSTNILRMKELKDFSGLPTALILVWLNVYEEVSRAVENNMVPNSGGREEGHGMEFLKWGQNYSQGQRTLERQPYSLISHWTRRG